MQQKNRYWAVQEGIIKNIIPGNLRAGIKRRDEYNKSNPYRDSDHHYIMVDH